MEQPDPETSFKARDGPADRRPGEVQPGGRRPEAACLDGGDEDRQVRQEITLLEIVGGAHLARSLEAVAVQGRVSVIGVIEGYDLAGSAGLLLLKTATIQGIRVGHCRALEDLVRAVDVLRLKPVIDRRYRFTTLPEALDNLDRGAFGKIVVTLD